MDKTWLLTVSTPYLTDYFVVKSENTPTLTQLSEIAEVDDVINEGYLEYEHIEEAAGEEGDLYEDYMAQTSLEVKEMSYEQIRDDIFNGEDPIIIKI